MVYFSTFAGKRICIKMKIIENYPENLGIDDSVITIGTFDGVHKGHQKILKRLKEIKLQKKLKSIVFTFYPHPRKIIQSHQNELKLLTTKSEKIQRLKNFNIDYLIFCPFTKEFSNRRPNDFVKYLIQHLNIKHVIIGYDHRFGKDRAGDINTFIQLKSQYDFEVEQIPAETIHEININSTKIRNLIQQGEIEKANELLSYRYFISGKVTEGKKIGSKMGIPTANIEINDQDKLIPANGVYCVEVSINKNKYKGAMNIGFNPTTDYSAQQKLEVHIINFNENIYHQNIQVSFIKKIRSEKKFDSINSLKNQILQDIELCKNSIS